MNDDVRGELQNIVDLAGARLRDDRVTDANVIHDLHEIKKSAERALSVPPASAPGGAPGVDEEGEDCGACDGTGKCWACNGTGTTPTPSTETPTGGR